MIENSLNVSSFNSQHMIKLSMTNKSEFPYLHGFSQEEQDRLKRQARFAEFKVYQDINFDNNAHILEVGCGVGAQSEILLRRFPNIKLSGIDLNEKQINAAKKNLESLDFAKERYDIQKMDAQNLEFDSNKFDGAFLCWVLEHIPNPIQVINEVRRVVRPGGKIYITEVLNSSFFLEPYSPNVWEYWMKFNDYQFEQAGDPFIGAKLGNLLMGLGLKDIKTTVKTWHFDNRWPEKRKETIDYWTDLLMSGKDQLINEKIISKELAEKAHQELKRVANDANAVFFYSFVQAEATII